MKDVAFLLGLVVVSAGIAMVHIPSGVIFAGVAISVVAYFSHNEPDEPTQ